MNKNSVRLFLVLAAIAWTRPNLPAHANMPVDTLHVKTSTNTAEAPVTVQTQIPGQVQPKPKELTWFARTLQFLGQVFTGTIFLSK